jgi:DNA-directed RNA polymerase specialized sigma24 family protein
MAPAHEVDDRMEVDDCNEEPLAGDVSREAARNHHHASGRTAGRKATMKTQILKLISRIENSASADVSLKDVRVLANSHDPEAIDALAGLLDDEGRVGREAFRALLRFGRAVEPTLRRCVRSGNPTVATRARELLAALGEIPASEVIVTGEAEVIHGTHDEAWAPDGACSDVELPPPVGATNDNGDVPPTDFARLTDPRVVRSITATLARRGIAGQDLEDGVADVQVKALEFLRTHRAPETIDEWKMLCNKIAADYATDALRKKRKRARYDVDLCEDPDAYLADPHMERERDAIDRGRLLQIVEEQLRAAKIPGHAFGILDAEATGTRHAEVAEELGLTATVVRNRLFAMRQDFRERVAARGMSDLLPQRAQTRQEGASPASPPPDGRTSAHRGKGPRTRA